MTQADPRAGYVERFERSEESLPGAKLPWVRELRREALASFSERGFPGKRNEEWRHTDVSALVATPFEAGRAGISASTPAGVRVLTLREALLRFGAVETRLRPWLGRLADAKTNPFTALNTALFEDGLVVEIEPGTVVEAPIEIEITGPSSGAAALRILVLAGAESRAAIVERYSGSGTYFTSAVSEIVVEPGAQLDHVRVQREAETAFHVASLVARQQAGSRFSSHSLALGAKLARVDVATFLDGEEADCSLHGLYLGHGEQVLDHHTWIDHATPRTRSRELYKGILSGRARGVFRGRIHVRPHAQQIDARQTSRTLLLSDDAAVNAKPQLEIYANDVKCSHGASIGRLDAEALFYLRSRGIAPDEAHALLVRAFASEVIEALPLPALRSELEAELQTWLAREVSR